MDEVSVAKVNKQYDGDVCEYLGVQGVGKTNFDAIDLYIKIDFYYYDGNSNLCDSGNLEFRDIQELSIKSLKVRYPYVFNLHDSSVTFFLREGSKRKREISALYSWASRRGKDRKMPVCEIRYGSTAPEDDKVWMMMRYGDDDCVFFDNMDVLLCKDFYDKIGVVNYVDSLSIVQNGLELLQIW
jgi:hypothetical protein